MLDALDRHRQWIAVEAFSLKNMDLKSMFQRFLPDARATFSKLSAAFAPNEIPTASFTKDQHQFIRLVQLRKYMDLAPLAATVPEGLESPYLQYLDALLPVAEHCAGAPERLTHYARFLATLLSSKDHRFSTNNSEMVYSKLEAERIALIQSVAKCFKNGSHQVDTRYDAVVDRNADWSSVFQRLQQVDDIVNKIDRKALHKTSKDVVEMLDRVIDMVSQGHLADGSPEVVQELADGAYQLGAELEFVAVTSYKVIALNQAVDTTTKTLFKILSNT